nr:A disintegrin and metalloproteinase with thrombospondin motifs 7-like [Biomphalaria glabrata]
MHTIGLASKKVAEESMEKAAREVKEKVGISNEEGLTDCGVSVDGTWQRRGHSSHHGVVTAISIETASQHVTTEKTISATLQRDTLWVLLMRKKSLGQSIIHGCSQLLYQLFEEKIELQVIFDRGYTCLVYAVEASADIPDVSDKLLGQVIKPDQQCQQFFGNDSFFCRASESRRSITEICQAMLCADVLRGLCIPHIALTGTSCGDGKVCINGQCVSDPYAPQIDGV